MQVTLWGTRGSLATPGPETARYGGNTSCVGVVGREGTMLVLDAGTGHPPPGGDDSRIRAPRRHPADAPAHGSHPGTGLLRAAVPPRCRGAHLGPGQRHAAVAGAPHALSVAAAVSGEPLRTAVQAHLPRRPLRGDRHRRIPRLFRAGVPPRPHGGIPHYGAGRRRADLPARPRARARPRCAFRPCRASGPRAARSPRKRTC